MTLNSVIRDPFAVSVSDVGRKVANLKRDSAKFAYEVIQVNKAKSRYLLRPLDLPEVKNRIIGPQQTCAIAFKCDDEDVTIYKELAKRHVMSGAYVKVMELPN